MTKQTLDKILICIFILMLSVPFIFAHRESGRISTSENRTLADPAQLFDDDGCINYSYSADFDSWINDNIAFRGTFMEVNAIVQYHLFGKIANTDLREGQNGHLYYVKEDMLREYQHTNLLSESELKNYSNAMQSLSTYLADRNIAFYYMQCYGKDSIYPEYYVEGVRQYGNISRVNQITAELTENTNVTIIPLYEELMQNKKNELLYFKATDPAHWNEYGAHIGYTTLLKTIQKDFPQISYLDSSDFNITQLEENADIYGFAYPHSEINLYYNRKEPHAIETDAAIIDPAGIIDYGDHTHYYQNPDCGNELRILLVGDSYIRQFIKGHIAESFSETLSIDWINLSNLDEIIDIYKPDILVFESAESCLDNTIPLTIGTTKYTLLD